jgi:hypothetical protein
MPQVNAGPPDYLLKAIQTLQQQVAAMQTQQNFVVVDSKTKVRAQLGLLPSGDYGLLLADPATGQQTEVLPTYAAYVDGVLAASTSYPSTIGGSPSVVATIGKSGDFEVSYGAYVATGTAGSSAMATLVVDGGTSAAQLIQVGVSSGTVQASVFSTRRWKLWTPRSGGTGLSVGTHTFGLQYASSAGTSNFSGNFLRIQPI